MKGVKNTDMLGNSIVSCLKCGQTIWKGCSEEGRFSVFINRGVYSGIEKTGWYCVDCADQFTML